MGRKKKIIVKQVQETPKTPNTTNSIAYQGTVKVSLMSGKKCLNTKTYYNTGCFKLFEFLCTTLGGNFNINSRPCQIMLFTSTTDTPSTPLFSSSLSITPYIIQDTTAVLDRTNEANNECSIIYHFRIPYSFISEANGSASIYKAALYNINPSDTDTSKYAYYLFTKTTNGVTEWDPIVLQNLSTGNYSIILEWKMTLSNKGE